MSKLYVALALFVSVFTGGSVFAYTASNTVPTSKAGAGSAAISGYTVSAIRYNLNSSNPTRIDSVAFSLDSTPAAGSTIKVKLEAAGTTWYSCSFAGTSVTCATSSPVSDVASADQLQIVVAQ